MKKFFRILLVSIYFWFLNMPCTLHAATKAEWIADTINFGLIPEDGGVKEGKFYLVNKGRKKLEIREVKASCGCTEIEYTKGKISKGDTAVVKVFFDPEDRPGKFDKGIYVFLGKEKIPVNLRIKGTVMAGEETLQFFYPYGNSDLRMEKDTLDFGKIKRGNKRRDFIDLYNKGSKAIKLEGLPSTDALRVEMTPEELHPGESGTMTVYIDTTRLSWIGDKRGTVKIKWGEGKEEELQVKANVVIAE